MVRVRQMVVDGMSRFWLVAVAAAMLGGLLAPVTAARASFPGWECGDANFCKAGIGFYCKVRCGPDGCGCTDLKPMD